MVKLQMEPATTGSRGSPVSRCSTYLFHYVSANQA